MNLYGVFFGTKWAMGRNKRQALALAKREKGYVGVIRNAYGYGTPPAWDAPTFRVTMTLIADYQVTGQLTTSGAHERIGGYSNMASGITFASVLGDLINKSAEEYATVLPSNLGKKARELAVAGFRDGMRTAIRHLEAMEVIQIERK